MKFSGKCKAKDLIKEITFRWYQIGEIWELDETDTEIIVVNQMVKDLPKKANAHTQYKLVDGTKVPSVTTVLGILNKPALVKWANNLGLQGI